MAKPIPTQPRLVAPFERDRDGQCPGLNCTDCYLKPATGRCPWKKD